MLIESRDELGKSQKYEITKWIAKKITNPEDTIIDYDLDGQLSSVTNYLPNGESINLFTV